MRRRLRRWRPGVSRRWFLASLAAACAAETSGKGRILPPAAFRYADPATENPIVRLTDPHFTSILPSAANRIVTRRGVLYASDITGNWQAFRMDLRNKESRQLTEAGALDPASLAFFPNERGFWHFDGPRLVETNLSHLKSRDLYEVPEGFEKLPGANYSEDGQYAAFVERSAERYRLRLVHLAKGTAVTLMESPTEIRDPLLRPRNASLIFRNNGEPWMIGIDGQDSRRVTLCEGETLQLAWAADGHALEYLNRPKDPRKLTNLREWTPESGQDAQIADTTQYACFQSNADSSAFVGASGSKASPYLLLLIRAVKRELTLAEHRASNAEMVTPLFAPNSQFVVFVSNRHGKPAIYWISVEKLVAETDGS